MSLGSGEVEGDGEFAYFSDGEGGSLTDMTDEDLGVDSLFNEGFELFEDFDGKEDYGSCAVAYLGVLLVRLICVGRDNSDELI